MILCTLLWLYNERELKISSYWKVYKPVKLMAISLSIIEITPGIGWEAADM